MTEVGCAQCGRSVLQAKLLHTKGLSHPMYGLGSTPSNFPFWENNLSVNVCYINDMCYGFLLGIDWAENIQMWGINTENYHFLTQWEQIIVLS